MYVCMYVEASEAQTNQRSCIFHKACQNSKPSLLGKDITRLIWGVLLLHGKQLHYRADCCLLNAVFGSGYCNRPEAKHNQMVLTCILFFPQVRIFSLYDLQLSLFIFLKLLDNVGLQLLIAGMLFIHALKNSSRKSVFT